MRQREPNLYEGMFIINAALTDDARAKAFEKIVDGLKRAGAEIVKMHDQGKRRLAYEIQSQKEGHYFVLYFRLAGQAVKEMWQEWRLNENLLRFMTLRNDKVLEEIKFAELPEL